MASTPPPSPSPPPPTLSEQLRDQKITDLTFGVELEFLIGWRKEDDHVSGTRAYRYDPARAAPRALTVPNKAITMFHSRVTPRAAIFRYITDHVHETIRSNGFEVGPFGSDWDTIPEAEWANNTYRGWEAKEEDSIQDTQSDKTPDIRWQAVEIVSPILPASDGSFSQVRNIVALLARTYNIHVAPTCGFHVHIGAGRDKAIPLPALRNMAALIWASEPLLATLHPPERILNHLVPSTRLMSNLANGIIHPADSEDDQSGNMVPIDDASAQPPAKTTIDDVLAEFPEFADKLRSSRHQPVRRAWDDPAAVKRNSDFVKPHGAFPYEGEGETCCPKPKMTGVFPAVHQILQAETAWHVASLMACDRGYSRPDYSFSGYSHPGSKLRTVEFRIAGGTMDPEWVRSWAQICASVLRFASDMVGREAVFLRFLRRMEVGTEHGLYGLDDLLNDIGCTSRCRSQVDSRLAKIRNEGWYEHDVYNVGWEKEEAVQMPTPSMSPAPTTTDGHVVKTRFRRIRLRNNPYTTMPMTPTTNASTPATPSPRTTDAAAVRRPTRIILHNRKAEQADHTPSTSTFMPPTPTSMTPDTDAGRRRPVRIILHNRKAEQAGHTPSTPTSMPPTPTSMTPDTDAVKPRIRVPLTHKRRGEHTEPEESDARRVTKRRRR